MNKFPENLKRLRLQAGYTKAELAEKVFAHVQSVSRWESGESQPSIETLCTVCDLFGVTLDELITDKKVSRDTMEKTVRTRFSQSESFKADLFRLAEGIINGRRIKLSDDICFPAAYYRITDRLDLSGVYSKKHELFGFFNRSLFKAEDTEALCGLFKALSDKKIIQLIPRLKNAVGWYDKESAARLFEISQTELDNYFGVLEYLGIAVKKQLFADGRAMEVYSFGNMGEIELLLCVAENIMPDKPARYIW